MTRRALAALALAALLTACADAAPPAPTSTPAAPSPNSGGLALPEPGRPFDPGALLAAMRESRRPDGVPDQLEIETVASTLADSIWTVDGDPWTAISAGGSCGPDTCTLEISGAQHDTQGDDLWAFAVAPATSAVTLVSSDLRSVPARLVGQLDALARSLLAPAALDGLTLTSVRWRPPPDAGQFVLSYRSGGEEGSCGADITLDAVRAEIVSGGSSNC